jgi:hypothetical protein
MTDNDRNPEGGTTARHYEPPPLLAFNRVGVIEAHQAFASGP